MVGICQRVNCWLVCPFDWRLQRSMDLMKSRSHSRVVKDKSKWRGFSVESAVSGRLSYLPLCGDGGRAASNVQRDHHVVMYYVCLYSSELR